MILLYFLPCNFIYYIIISNWVISMLNNFFPNLDEDFSKNFLKINPKLEKDLKQDIIICSYPSTFFFDGKKYKIPYRIGYESEIIQTKSDEIEEIIKLCLLTRHHNGFIREKSLVKLLHSNYIEKYQFVIAYIIRLLGEYVQNIWLIIYNNRESITFNALIKFREENLEFIKKN